MSRLPHRPRLALPFTFLTAAGQVRLVAGEDFRYTLTAPELDRWLPDWLAGLDGRRTLEEALASLPAQRRDAARQLAARLSGERVLIDGPAEAAHVPSAYRLAVEGSGPLREQLVARTSSQEQGPIVRLLCQDRLDYDEVLRFNEKCLQERVPFVWVSWGALQRGLVSPLHLPDAGPCLACLVGHFRRRSPEPELYDELIAHAQQGKPLAAAPFPERGQAVLRELVLWKIELLPQPMPPAALFQLHVLETATLQISSHRVYRDPECPACRDRP
jgi:bacteriocin biosynthesis cyclodehydratase domain-containing protein